MMNDNEDELIDSPVLNMEIVKKKLSLFSQQKLCEMVVCGRYFKLNNDLSILCMEELSKRRQNGDIFDFESYIESLNKELPPLNFQFMDIRSVLTQLVNKK